MDLEIDIKNISFDGGRNGGEMETPVFEQQ